MGDKSTISMKKQTLSITIKLELTKKLSIVNKHHEKYP